MVQFLSEHNRRSIQCQAHKLRNLHAEYPRADIAPNRTKKEQDRFRYFSNECSERQAKGERIIINGRITQDKRPSKDYSVDSSLSPIFPQNISNKMVN